MGHPQRHYHFTRQVGFINVMLNLTREATLGEPRHRQGRFPVAAYEVLPPMVLVLTNECNLRTEKCIQLLIGRAIANLCFNLSKVARKNRNSASE